MDLDRRVFDRLAATTRFSDIRGMDVVDSTNRFALDEARAGAGEGLVVLAALQQAGRGRLGRTWQAPAGSALMASVLLRPTDLPPSRWHLLTAAVALAAADACAATTGLRPELKWPNDLLVGPAKLAGVLAEVAVPPGRAGGPAVVVGIGCNLTASPDGATDLAAETGAAPRIPVLLEALLVGLEDRLGRWDTVAAEYRTACATPGRRVRVEQPAGVREGTATGLDDAGRLLVDFDGGGTEALSAADVTHLRPAGGGGW